MSCRVTRPGIESERRTSGTRAQTENPVARNGLAQHHAPPRLEPRQSVPMNPIRAIRGMNDIVPDDVPPWQYIERHARALLDAYGYREIRPPVVERTELFRRSIGEVTDIVEKEMYTFDDRNGESLTLRPECTASVVRAAIEHGLLRVPGERVWAMGPMFRYERPQKGRYRQFHQIDVEILGIPAPSAEAELIVLTRRLWKVLGISGLALELNSLGSRDIQARYRTRLVEYFSAQRRRWTRTARAGFRRTRFESSTRRTLRCRRWSRMLRGYSTCSTATPAPTSTDCWRCSTRPVSNTV